MLQADALVEVHVVDAERHVVAPLHGAARDPRVVARDADILARVLQAVDAGLDLDVAALDGVEHAGVDVLDVLGHFRDGRAHAEMVVREARDQARVGAYGRYRLDAGGLVAQRVRHRAQQVVAALEAEVLVDDLEVRDVEVDEREPLCACLRVVEQLLGALVERGHVQQPGQAVGVLVHRDDLRLGEAVAVLVVELVLVDVYYIYIEELLAAGAVEQVAEVLDVARLALLRDDAVAHVVVLLVGRGGLRLDVVLDFLEVVGVDHALEAVADVLAELGDVAAAEQLDDVLLREVDLLVAERVVDEEPARQPRWDVVFVRPDHNHARLPLSGLVTLYAGTGGCRQGRGLAASL